MTRNLITMDSFGADLPTNWAEIAAYLNEIIDRENLDHDEANELWERYCNGDIPGAPKAE